LKTGAGLVPRSNRGAVSSGKSRLKAYSWFSSKKRYPYPGELKKSPSSLRRYELFNGLIEFIMGIILRLQYFCPPASYLRRQIAGRKMH